MPMEWLRQEYVIKSTMDRIITQINLDQLITLEMIEAVT